MIPQIRTCQHHTCFLFTYMLDTYTHTGKRNAVKVVEVELALSSLNDGDVFVLDNGLQLYQWNGAAAGVFEKRQGQEIIKTIKYVHF